MSGTERFTVYCPERNECGGLFRTPEFAKAVNTALRPACSHAIVPVHSGPGAFADWRMSAADMRKFDVLRELFIDILPDTWSSQLVHDIIEYVTTYA